MLPKRSGKTVAFLALDAQGHINAMIGLADALRALGHTTLFICNDNQAPRHFGHRLILLRDWRDGEHDQDEPEVARERHSEAAEAARTDEEESVFVGDARLNAKWAQRVDLLDLDVCKAESVERSLTHNYRLLCGVIEAEIVPHDSTVERILLRHKPDLLLVDQFVPWPSVWRLGRRNALRWATLCSCNPLPLHHTLSAGRLPPPLMGASLVGNGGDAKQAMYGRVLRESGILAALQRLAKIAGIPPDATDEFARFARNQSPHLNLYMFPRELDYEPERRLAGLPEMESLNWWRVDSLVRRPLGGRADELALQQVALWREDRPRVTIVYLSLGSTMSSNLRLLNNLLLQVFRCADVRPRYRFVLALGHRGQELPEETRQELSRRQRASRLLARAWWPQPELLRRRLADVCVSHGGNNTLCELFQAPEPRPALVLVPAFHDQLDNGRRVEELRRGVSLPVGQLLSEAPAPDLLRGALERSLRLRAATVGKSNNNNNNNNPMATTTANSLNGNKLQSPQLQPRDSHYCARLIETKLLRG